jgi:hypothetical protein
MMLPISGVEAVLASNGISITEDLPSDTAANCARDRISKRAKINILGCACDDISADCAAYELYDQINENSRHCVISPKSETQYKPTRDTNVRP